MDSHDVLRAYRDNFLFFTLPFVRMPEIHFASTLSEEEDFILHSVLMAIGLPFRKKMAAAQHEMIANVIVFNGIAISLLGDMPTNVVELFFTHMHRPPFRAVEPYTRTLMPTGKPLI